MDEQNNMPTGASAGPNATQPAQTPAAETQGGYQPFGEQPATPAATSAPADTASAAAAPDAAATQPAAAATPTAAPAQPAPVVPAQPAAVPGVQPSATPALVCGILAILLCGFPIVGIALGIVAIVLAGKYFRAGGTAGTGTAGRVCGIVGIVLSVIMIIVGIAITMMAINLYNNDDLYESLNAAQSSSSSSYSYNAYEDAEEEEQAVFDVVNARLDQMKDQDPEMLAYVANMLETSFNESMSDIGLDTTITLQGIGVDPTELAKLMLDGFDYEAFSVRIDSSDPNEAEANYYLTVRSMYDVEDEFIDRIDDLYDSANNMTTDQAMAALGQALIASVQAVEPEEDSFIDLDMTYANGAWTIDQKSWDDEMEYFFEFY